MVATTGLWLKKITDNTTIIGKRANSLVMNLTRNKLRMANQANITKIQIAKDTQAG